MTGKKLVIPLFGAVLVSASSYKLCDGISLIALPKEYGDKLCSTPDIIARYVDSLPHMKIGVEIEPGRLLNGDQLDWYGLLEFGYFIAMTIRLVTGVPLDIPYWFDVEKSEIKGHGNSLIRTFRTGRKYLYPLDDGKQSSGLSALQNGISDLAQKYILDSNKNVLVRAIEFAAIGYQTRHVPSRLVNHTIFLESLFSCSQFEIGFQISSSVSWYLMNMENSDERLKLFSRIKELYGFRSKIVDGSDISSKNKNLVKNLVFSEELNSNIMKHILDNKHIEIFSMNQNKRQEELKSLTLGADCLLLENQYNH